MAIIVSKNGTGAQKIDESHFGLEDKLQEYVKNNPDIVPIYEINEDARLLIMAREFRTNSGPIDALGVDQDGNLYIIETKLYKNADKRLVLAQALDYGASLWRHSGDTSEFVEAINQKVQAHFSMSLDEKLQEFFGTDEPQRLIDVMAKNVSSGNIKFVILMDRVEDRLKDLVTYVNQNSRFDIYAVDLKYYKYGGYEIVIPKLYGSEVKKEVSAQDDTLRFDNQKIIDWINELDIDYFTIDWNNSTKTYIRFTTANLDRLIPHREENNGGWSNGKAYSYEIRTDRSGWVKIQLALSSEDASETQRAGQSILASFVQKQPKKEDWKWFTVAGWKVDYQHSEQILKVDIQRVISQDIPEFEAKLVAFANEQ